MSKIPIEIDLSIKRRNNSSRLKTKGINQRFQFVNPVGDKFLMPSNCQNNHTPRTKASKYRCSTITKKDVLEFRRHLFASTEKRDQFEYLNNYISILTPKSHVGNAEVARIMTIDYTIPNIHGNKICVCRSLFMAASGMNQRRLQNINKKLYKDKLLSNGLVEDFPSDLDETEKGKRLKDMITNRKERLLSIRKGELESFKNIIRTNQVTTINEDSYDDVIQEEISIQQNSEPTKISYENEDFYEQIQLDLDSLEICRICCKNHENLTSLFTTVDSLDLTPSNLLTFLVSCHINPSDNLPQKICDPCLSNLVIGCQLKKDWMESQKLMQSCMTIVKQQEVKNCVDSEIYDNYDAKLETEYQKQQTIDNEMLNMEWLENPETEEIVYDQDFEKEQEEIDESRNENLEDSEEIHQKDNGRKRFASKIKPAKCYFCDKDFETTAEEHFQTHHNYVERKQCDKCTFETEFPWFLNLHYQLHAEEDFKLCNVCGRHIPRLSIYRHRRYCGVKKEPSGVKYPCEYCGQTYHSAYFRNVHQRIHTNEKPYSCEKCHKSFHRRILLRQHMLQHGVEPDFKCFCGKGFVLRHRWINHQTTCSAARKYNNDLSTNLASVNI